MTSVFASGEAGHAVHELPLEPVWFGVIALVVFLGLLGLLWSFRNSLGLDPVAHHHEEPPPGGGSATSHH